MGFEWRGWQLLSTAKSPMNELLRWVRAFIGITRFDALFSTQLRGQRFGCHTSSSLEA
jgi:hypothetical protein